MQHVFASGAGAASRSILTPDEEGKDFEEVDGGEENAIIEFDDADADEVVEDVIATGIWVGVLLL